MLQLIARIRRANHIDLRAEVLPKTAEFLIAVARLNRAMGDRLVITGVVAVTPLKSLMFGKIDPTVPLGRGAYRPWLSVLKCPRIIAILSGDIPAALQADDIDWR